MHKHLLPDVLLSCVLLITLQIEPLFARIQMLNSGDETGQFARNRTELLSDLSRITGVPLEISNGYLTSSSAGSANLNLLFSPARRFSGNEPFSASARQLLLSAIQSENVYTIKPTRGTTLGKTEQENSSILLNFAQISGIVFRGLPHKVFNVAMIFLHELVHVHVGLTDPSIQEAKVNPFSRGRTVEYMNRIERELGLPERQHYYPKILTSEATPRLSIFFGEAGARVELPQ